MSRHKKNYAREYDFEIIDFLQRSGRIDNAEAKFMRHFVRGTAKVSLTL